jgi:hypothetical protein
LNCFVGVSRHLQQRRNTWDLKIVRELTAIPACPSQEPPAARYTSFLPPPPPFYCRYTFYSFSLKALPEGPKKLVIFFCSAFGTQPIRGTFVETCLNRLDPDFTGSAGHASLLKTPPFANG